MALAGSAPSPGWGRAVVGLGLVTLLVIDRVYDVARIRGAGPLHSAHVLGTGLLLAAVGARVDLVVVTVAVIKGVLYLARQVKRARLGCAASPGLTVPRLGFLVAGVGGLWQDTGLTATVALILLGEIIDRGLYYHELEIDTPDSLMLDELETRPEAHGVFAVK